MISAMEPVNEAKYAITGQMVYYEYLTDRKEIRLPRGYYVFKTNSLSKKVLFK